MYPGFEGIVSAPIPQTPSPIPRHPHIYPDVHTAPIVGHIAHGHPAPGAAADPGAAPAAAGAPGRQLGLGVGVGYVKDHGQVAQGTKVSGLRFDPAGT